MSETADIVVAGAGHNSLITAAYLAKAGYDVLGVGRAPCCWRRCLFGRAAFARIPDRFLRPGHALIQTNPLMLHGRAGFAQ